MMGRSHIAVNVSIGVTISVMLAAQMESEVSVVASCSTALFRFLFPDEIMFGTKNGLENHVILFGLSVIFMFVIGSILPDMDQKHSTIGKHFHLPMKHHRWTHTLWFVLIGVLLSFAHIVFRFLTFGYALHILGDSVSTAGVAWLYPITKYREYPNGAFVARNHHVKLYRTNAPSEGRFVVIVILLCGVLCVFERNGFAILGRWLWC